jgi:acetyltransferase-like isoleucine patch superfamily enzyme
MKLRAIRALPDKITQRVLGWETWARRQGVTIGTGCRILSNVATSEPWLVSIGDRVTISSRVSLVTHDGSGWLVNDEKGRRYRYAPIRMGNDVFVGAGATIMPGVELGDRVVVGAGSVVTRSVPSGTVVAGVPARPVSTWDDFVGRVEKWKTASDLRGTTYRERVDSVAEPLMAMPDN